MVCDALDTAPNEKMKDVLKRTVSDVKASVSKVAMYKPNQVTMYLAYTPFCSIKSLLEFALLKL